ncbi:hypothetical protein NC651_008073 [Populus alba x Populus x berolinensis]|nr:hypothetical protein NC651_008073 [Populus alba x Populus x berolinensis]
MPNFRLEPLLRAKVLHLGSKDSGHEQESAKLYKANTFYTGCRLLKVSEFREQLLISTTAQPSGRLHTITLNEKATDIILSYMYMSILAETSSLLIRRTIIN